MTPGVSGPLSVTQAARLVVEGGGFVPHQVPLIDRRRPRTSRALHADWPVTLTGGGVLNVAGPLTPSEPVMPTGGNAQRGGARSAPGASPLTFTGSSLAMAGATLTSPTPTGDVTPARSTALIGLRAARSRLIGWWRSATFAAVLDQLRDHGHARCTRWRCRSPGRSSVDATSRIDVSGKGYPARLHHRQHDRRRGDRLQRRQPRRPGRRGLRTHGRTNRPYGDYADPDEPGTGGDTKADGPGGGRGGLVRIAAAVLVLEGQILADGAQRPRPGDAGAAAREGRSAWIVDRSPCGVDPAPHGGERYGGRRRRFRAGGGGGGGRIAVYARDPRGFDASRASVARAASAAGPGTEAAAPGTVHIAQGSPHTHVRSHFPYGRPIDFVDHGNGYVSHPIDSITLKFNRPSTRPRSIPPSSRSPARWAGSDRPGSPRSATGPIASTCPSPYPRTAPITSGSCPALRDVEGFRARPRRRRHPGRGRSDGYAFDAHVRHRRAADHGQSPDGDVAGHDRSCRRLVQRADRCRDVVGR